MKDPDYENQSRFSICKALTRKVFSRRQRTKQDKQLLWVLLTRAWVLHMFYSVTQLSMKIFKVGIQQEMSCIIGHEKVGSDSFEQSNFYREIGVEDED